MYHLQTRLVTFVITMYFFTPFWFLPRVCHNNKSTCPLYFLLRKLTLLLLFIRMILIQSIQHQHQVLISQATDKLKLGFIVRTMGSYTSNNCNNIYHLKNAIVQDLVIGSHQQLCFSFFWLKNNNNNKELINFCVNFYQNKTHTSQ